MEVSPEVPKVRRRDGHREGRTRLVEPEMLVGIGALLVSLCALGVGMYEAMLERHQVRAESWPHVELELSMAASGFTVDVVNSGIGPAMIDSFDVTIDGRRATGWRDVLNRAFKVGPGYSVSTITDRVVRAGDRITVLQVPPALVRPDTFEQLPHIGVAVCYSSVFDEHWRADTPKLLGRTMWGEVSSCPRGHDDIGGMPASADAIAPF